MEGTYFITSEVAWAFFNTDHFWEQNKIDGKTIKDLEILMKDGYHLGYYHNDVLICATKVEQVNDMDGEVHTYVNPAYLKLSEIALKSHIDFLAHKQGYRQLYTVSSNVNQSCYNFLRKRLGFHTYQVDTECPVTRDGEQLIIYKMVRVL